ncbi:MAG TPA: single-stranded DNA-binding protein [Tissierellia bacterium]|nr:single-stranded DNA-binding protein [Tissierellia bacterium]
MLNNLTLSGVLIKDPELRAYRNEENTPYTFVTLLTTKGHRSQKTTLVPVRIVDKPAEAFCEHKKKGDRVDITGYVDGYVDDNNRLKTFIHATHVEYREKKKTPTEYEEFEPEVYEWPDQNLDGSDIDY